MITDTRFGRDPLALLPVALDAGVDVVQVRVKELGDRDVLAVVEAALSVCEVYGATCIVDDRLDVALAAGAHGVHLGDQDLPVARARAVAGPGLLIGATVRDPAAAQAAQADGASYLGVGPVYATATKRGLPAPIGVAGVESVCKATGLPVIAIGGVGAGGIGPLLAAGVHGVAVVGAISDAADPRSAARALAESLALAPAVESPAVESPAVESPAGGPRP
jgi:thiamine-phosphate pyrophosphorylase